MGLLSKGLIGLLFDGGNSKNRGGYYSSSGGRSAPIWECRYCGRKQGAFQRPSPNRGRCPNSPYGTHYWEQM